MLFRQAKANRNNFPEFQLFKKQDGNSLREIMMVAINSYKNDTHLFLLRLSFIYC